MRLLQLQKDSDLQLAKELLGGMGMHTVRCVSKVITLVASFSPASPIDGLALLVCISSLSLLCPVGSLALLVL